MTGPAWRDTFRNNDLCWRSGLVVVCLAAAFFLGYSAASGHLGKCPFASPYIRTAAMANDVPEVMQRPVGLLFGDSLTERSMDSDGGWGAALYHHFSRKLDLVNRGFGGYNTRWALPLLDVILHQLQGQNIKLMTIFFGANDAALPDRSAARQHVPVDEYKSNLEKMVGKAQAAGVESVVLITPPPVSNGGRVKHQQMRAGTTEDLPPDRTLDHTGQYAAACKELGEKLKVPVVDLWGEMQKKEGWQELHFIDGLHFSPEGTREVARLLLRVIEEKLPQLELSKLANQFPWSDKWDPEDPQKFWEGFKEQHEQKGKGGKSIWG